MIVVAHDCKMSRAHLDQLGDRTVFRVHFKRARRRSLHRGSQYCIHHSTMTRDQHRLARVFSQYLIELF